MARQKEFTRRAGPTLAQTAYFAVKAIPYLLPLHEVQCPENTPAALQLVMDACTNLARRDINQAHILVGLSAVSVHARDLVAAMGAQCAAVAGLAFYSMGGRSARVAFGLASVTWVAVLAMARDTAGRLLDAFPGTAAVTLLGGLALMLSRRAPVRAGLAVGAIAYAHLMFWVGLLGRQPQSVFGVFGLDVVNTAVWVTAPAAVYGAIATFSSRDSRDAALHSLMFLPLISLIRPI
ncbi:unnamed protein product [Pedinophyceae sp. YPF-701]|nr:unnamed protein product [Pedinophyceae sp. YPF-701]